MTLIYLLQDYIYKIPQSTTAFLLGALTFRIYLNFLKDNDLKLVLADKFWNFLIIFLLTTRFSGLILHPTNFLTLKLYQMLAGPPANGWILGLLVGLAYSTWSLYKDRLINPNTIFLITIGVIIASLPTFLFRMSYNLYPYNLQDLLRLGFAVLLLLLILIEYPRRIFIQKPQRLWLAIGVFLLATSVLTPQLDKWMLFSAVQWIEIFLIFLVLLIEVLQDLGLNKSND